jgi:hypothetical protein
MTDRHQYIIHKPECLFPTRRGADVAPNGTATGMTATTTHVACSAHPCQSSIKNQKSKIVNQKSKILFFLFLFLLPSLYSQQAGIQEIKFIEYFIDSDPGVGKAARLSNFTPFAEGTVSVDNIDVSHLTEGIHRVFVRAVTDSMQISITQHRTFYRTKLRTLPNVTQLEYFIDTDPGIGKAKKINISSPGIDLNEYPVNIELDEAASGAHTLYIRACDASGKWSITQQRTFQQFYQKVTPELTGLEYFIDSDPGFGKGKQLALSGTEENRLFSVDVTDLEPGMHTLYVRSRNEFFFWSVTQNINFVKAGIVSESEVSYLEYFIDADPGFGKAHPVNITAGKNITAYFNVNPDTLSTGLHTLYLRARNAEGRWTVTQNLAFMRIDDRPIPDVVALEWFIDSDPGFGKAQAVPAAQGTVAFPVDIQHLETGVHTLYLRAKNSAGHWSITHDAVFVKIGGRPIPDVVALEWFIDSDPGFGNAQAVSAAQGTVAFPVDIQHLEAGLHTLYLRAKNSVGQWSITQDVPFIRIEILSPAKITAYEWFVDVDPGFGNAASFTAVAPTEKLEKTVQINTSEIGAGLHTIFVRVRDEKGNWSITQYSTFLKTVKIPAANLAAAEWFINDDPGFGNATQIALSGMSGDHSFVLNLTSMLEDNSLQEGLNHLYVRAKNDKGRWSITQNVLFNLIRDTMDIAPVSEIEWFIDEDPGFGNAPSSQRFVYGVPQRVIIQPFQIDISALPEGWHSLYVRAKNTLGHWSVTQYQPFVKVSPRGLTGLEYFIDSDKGFGKNTGVAISGQEAVISLNIDGAALSDGLHTLYVRACNEAGSWGITQTHTFMKVSATRQAPGVKSAEWFIDSDPGFGKATPIAIGPNNTALIQIDSDIPEGLHTLYLRAIDNLGLWSVTQNIAFYTLTVEDIPDLVALEWFIDTDPGAGNAATVPLTPGRDATRKVTVAVGDLDGGIHHIYLRVKDSNGAWSITQYAAFHKIKLDAALTADLKRMEYFIDKDPGFGGATPITLSGQAADESFTVSLDRFAAGFHTLYVRAENSAGKWGITHSFSFMMMEIPDDYLTPDVTALEYFIDSDPGYGQAQRVYFDQKGQKVQKSFAVDISNIQPGMHTFYVRAVNEAGKWGITHRSVFIKSDIPKDYELPELARLEYFIDSDPGFGQGEAVDLPAETNTGALFRVDLDEYADGPHTLYIRAIDSIGKWTITQSFGFYRTDIPVNISKDIVYLEYFINDDPGFGKGEEIVILSKGVEINQTVFIPTDKMWPGEYTVYFRALDARGLWTITQNISVIVVDNPRLGGYPDIVAIEYFFDDDPGFGKAEKVKVDPGGLNIQQHIFIPLDTVPEGMHTLYIRGKNSNGEWTLTNYISIFSTGISVFEELGNVIGFEYFIDEDPGTGQAHYFAAQSPGITAQQRITVNVDTLKTGLHTLYVRALGNLGEWSITQRNTFLRVRVRPQYPVTALEYFLDKDPGFGKGRQVSVTQGATIDRTFNIDLPDTLSVGVHTLYVRARNTADEWSITHSTDFTKIKIRQVPGLAAMEYFVDSDPGFGKGEPMPVSENTPVTLFIPLNDLEEGAHSLYIRAKNTDGIWSVTQNMDFFTINTVRDIKITEMEYFVDVDPGFGKATKVPDLIPSANINRSFAVSLSSFNAGLHTLYVRALDEKGKWSVTQNMAFIRLEDVRNPNIVQAEYYIDQLKDFGEGTAIPVTAGAIVQSAVTVNTSALADGFHTIFVRVKDSDGAWSITQRQQFVKQTQHAAGTVTALEWFIDNDPGFDKANPVAVSDGTVIFPVNTLNMEAGIHTLYVRTRDGKGRWSITQDMTFIRFEDEIPADIVAFEWFIDTDPGLGKSPEYTAVTPEMQIVKTVQVDVSALSPGIHNMFVRVLDSRGAWSITQHAVFLKTVSRTIPDLVAMEYFIDTDPGFGNAEKIADTDGSHSYVLNLTPLMESSLLNEGPHTLYLRAVNEEGQWSVTQNVDFVLVKDEREIADITEIEWFIDEDPGYGNAPLSQRFVYSTPQRIIIQPFQIDASSLSDGWHQLYVRAKNEEGQWSVTQYQSFLKMKSRDLAFVEYFIDEDKGFGKNIVQAVSGESAIVSLNIPSDELDNGVHTLYVRAQSTAGAWGITQEYIFIKVSPTLMEFTSEVVAIEWFIEEDPGFGKATQVTVAPNGTAMIHVDESDIPSAGMCTLYARAVNKNGAWGISQHYSFHVIKVESIPDVVALEWFIDTDPGVGDANHVAVTPGRNISKKVTVSASNIADGLHRIYVRAKDSRGSWSITQYTDFIRVSVPSLGQVQVTAIEYFIDKDPGFGKAVQKAVAPATSIDTQQHIVLDTVPEGMHTLYVRARNTSGEWSLTHNINFLKVFVEAADPAEVSDVEWFLDDDPGYGNATPIPAFTSAVKISQKFPLVLTGIDDGVHTLYVRARDNKDSWGVTQWQSFLKSSVRVRPKVMAAEWFLDSDPGFGKANKIDISPAVYDYTASILIRPEDIRSTGVHTLYARTLDDLGKWSITQNMNLIVLDMKKQEASKTMALEYFFDNDPGFGKGKRINVSPTATDVDRRFMISGAELSAMEDGVHTLYVRAINEEEEWSITHSVHIVKLSGIRTVPADVVRIEYFLDNDPGFGKAKPVPVSPSDNIDKFFDIDVAGLALGPHTLYIRAISSSGKWSITTFSVELEVADIPPETPGSKPKGGILTPASSEVCASPGNPALVMLTLKDYEQRIYRWEYRHFYEDGSVNFSWKQVPDNSQNRESMIFRPDQPGKWEYRVYVTKGDRGPEYSTIAEIIVIGAAQGGKVTATTPEYVCSGKSFTVTLEEYKGDIVQWQHRLIFEGDTSAWQTIPYSNRDETIPVTPSSGGEWQYRAEVEMGECSNTFSKEAKVKVIDATTGGHVEPATLTSCVGKNFELEAKEYLGDVIAWQMSEDGGNTWTNFIHTDKYYNVTLSAVGEIQYRAVVKAGNCDETYSEPAVVTVLNEVDAAQDITGPAVVCKPATQVLYITPEISHVEEYQWTLPTGITFDGADNGNRVYLNFTDAAISGEITVRGYTDLCGYGTEASFPVIVYAKPETPKIEGAKSVCAGQQYIYTVTKQANMTYSWTVPAGWTIVEQDENVITVIPTGISGEMTVTVTNTDTGCSSEPGKEMLILLPSAETGPIYRLPNFY